MTQDREIRIQDNLADKDEIIPFKYSITSYGADYPVDGLVKRMSAGDIFLPTFQRSFVWTYKQASGFIESLLLGLPVPGIFLARDEESRKLLVIDGHQRLKSLQFFYEGIFASTGKEFKLKDVQPQFLGKTYKTLDEDDRRRLDDSILHATIVKQDEPEDDNSSIYYIFERLNTGGKVLSAQEIRAAISQGEFNDLLVKLNSNPSWRAMYGPISSRMRDQELIVRFLALYYAGESYEKPMKTFLNKFMKSNRYLRRYGESDIRSIFESTTRFIHTGVGAKAFKPGGAFIAALYDAVMVGTAKRLSKGAVGDTTEFKRRLERLEANQGFLDARTTHTSDEDNVSKRLKLAIDAFANIK